MDKAIAAVAAAGAPHGSDTSNDPGCSGGGVIPVLFGGDEDEGLAGVDHDGAAHGSSISLLEVDGIWAESKVESRLARYLAVNL
jgi:hypothetical protein